MIEASILKFVETQKNYNKFKEILKDKFFTPHTEFIFSTMGDILKTEEKVDWSTFIPYIKMKTPSISSDRLTIYEDIIKHIEDVDTTTIDSSIIKSFIERESAGRIYSITDSIFNGFDIYSMEDVKTVISDFEKDVDFYSESKRRFVTKDPLMLRSLAAVKGYEWRLEALNNSLGALIPASLVLFCARPDGGKTTMVISEAGYMASQLQEGENVLFVCNEEPGESVFTRIICSITGTTFSDFNKDPEKVFEDYKKRTGGDKVLVYYEESCNVKTVERLIEQNNVKLLVLDQLRKFNIGTNRSTDPEYQRLHKLFAWARGCGSKYRIPVLCVHQCDGTAEGQKYLHMGQIHGSNTDIQGECDVIVMIGRAHGEDLQRGLSIVKNKLPGANPAFRNHAWDVKIDRDIGRFNDR